MRARLRRRGPAAVWAVVRRLVRRNLEAPWRLFKVVRDQPRHFWRVPGAAALAWSALALVHVGAAAELVAPGARLSGWLRRRRRLLHLERGPATAVVAATPAEANGAGPGDNPRPCPCLLFFHPPSARASTLGAPPSTFAHQEHRQASVPGNERQLPRLKQSKRRAGEISPAPYE